MGEDNIENIFTAGSCRESERERKDEVCSVLSDNLGVQLCHFNIRAPSESTDDW